MVQNSLRFHIIGNPENRRIEFFQAALRNFGLPPARVYSYLDLFSHQMKLPAEIGPESVLRIESPGENFEVEKAILSAGVEAAIAEGSPTIEPDEIRRLKFDRGLILYPRQWYLGYRTLLKQLADQFASISRLVLLNQPDDIAMMFDKSICHARCSQAGLPVPQELGVVRDYEELLSRMGEMSLQRVFIKLANGSSASGVVALSYIRKQPLAITTTEMVSIDGRTQLYNSLKVRSYRDPVTIAQLINSLCRERVHVEEWLPKASLGYGSFDLRIVAIDGEPCHMVVRQSRSPMTNLHLGNRRGDAALLLQRLGPARWTDVQKTCRRTAALFPGTLYAGLDICLTPGWRRHAVLEVNAFGDLLPDVCCNGMDTYSVEVASILTKLDARKSASRLV